MGWAPLLAIGQRQQAVTGLLAGMRMAEQSFAARTDVQVHALHDVSLHSMHRATVTKGSVLSQMQATLLEPLLILWADTGLRGVSRLAYMIRQH